jgi:hypothetical protein
MLSFVFIYIVGSTFIFNISRGKVPQVSDLMTTFVGRHAWPQAGIFLELTAYG